MKNDNTKKPYSSKQHFDVSKPQTANSSKASYPKLFEVFEVFRSPESFFKHSIVFHIYYQQCTYFMEHNGTA